MTQEYRKRPRRKGRKRKGPRYFNLRRLCILGALFLVLIVSVCAVGYVIFFRTVVTKEILPALRSAIVFEEPDPPLQLDQMEQAEPVETTTAESAVREETRVGEKEGTESGSIRAPVAEEPAPGSSLPTVAIIIDDMGYDAALGQKLLELPIELTYSFLPFAPHTKRLEQQAHSAGKTIFLHLPLQPKGTAYSPGPGAIYLEDSPEAQRAKLIKCLREVPHAVGVNNHMGSFFTENKQAMSNIIQGIKERSLIFVDSCTSSASVAFEVARAASLKSARRNVFLDNVQDEQKICGQLEKLVEIAEKKGKAIGIAHPHRATVNALAMCSTKYQARVRYVSVPEVLTARY